MKFVSQLLLSILSFQLGVGQAIAQVGPAVVETIDKRDKQKTARDIEQYPDLNDGTPNPIKNHIGELTKEELAIDTSDEANNYVRYFITQAEWFEEQCTERKEAGVYVKWDTSFVLHKNIPYADMDIRNCGDEHEKLSHMHEVAKELAEYYGPEDDPEAFIRNQNCSDANCSRPGGLPAIFEALNPDSIPPGDKCSLEVQTKMAAEGCGFLKAMGSAVTHWSCIGNIVKGLINGLIDSIKGIGKLIWAGLKGAYNWVKDKVWGIFNKAETKADEGVLAVSKKKQEEYKEYEKDKEGWIQRNVAKLWDILKEVLYVGMWERESKCMNCEERGNLLCEVGGRILNDVWGMSFALGFGTGLVSAITKKIAGGLSDVTAKISKMIAGRGGKVATATKVAAKNANKVTWAGKLAIYGRNLSTKTRGMWNRFKNSTAMQAILKPSNKTQLGRLLRSKVVQIPKKIVLAPVKLGGRYLRYDQRIFAGGAYNGASLFGLTNRTAARELMQSMLPKLDKAEVVLLEDSKTRLPTLRYEKGGDGLLREVAGVDANAEPITARLEVRSSTTGAKGAFNRLTKNSGGKGAKSEWRVWEAPESYFDAERRAEYKRAGIEIPDHSTNGMYRIETPNSNFKKLFRKEYATQRHWKFDVPMSKDEVTVAVIGDKIEYIPGASKARLKELKKQGAMIVTDRATVARYGDKVEVIPMSKLTNARMKDLESKGAIFTTTDHPGWEQKINPNHIDSKYISSNLQDQGKIAFVTDNKVHVIEAKDVTPEFMADLEKDHKAHKVTIIQKGLDSPEVISKWEKGKIPGQDMFDNTALKQQYDLATKGLYEEKMNRVLEKTDELKVLLTRNEDEILQAQQKLSKQKGFAGELERMHDNFPITDVVSKDNRLEFTLLNEQKKRLPFKSEPGNKVVSVDAFDDGTKVIVRQEDGTTHLFRLTEKKDAELIGKLDKSHIHDVQNAMGELWSGKKLESAKELETVEMNLKSRGKKGGTEIAEGGVPPPGDDYWFTKNQKTGEKTLQIRMEPGCGKGVISVGCLHVP